MGNCLRSQAKIVRIMKTDGKILEYRPSIIVDQVLSSFKGHALSDMIPVQQYLDPDTELVGGHLYYLIPLPTLLQKPEKKKVRFSEPVVAEEEEKGRKTSLRIKLVISKQELKEMLKNGVILLDGFVPQVQQEEGELEYQCFHGLGTKAWKPALKSIPELD